MTTQIQHGYNLYQIYCCGTAIPKGSPPFLISHSLYPICRFFVANLLLEPINSNNNNKRTNPTPTGKGNYWMWARRNGVTTTNNFLTADGEAVRYVAKIGLKTAAEREKFLIGQTKDVGRYEVCCEWKPDPKTHKSSSHVFILERQQNGNLVRYDPQSGLKNKEIREYYLKEMVKTYLGVRRIDDKLINIKVAERLLKSTK